MDSPLPRPRVDRTYFSEDDDGVVSTPLLFQWAHSIKPLYRALLFVLLSSAFSAIMFSSLPLWRPIGVLMLHKLWDIFMFVVLTTSIGLGIINCNLWRGNDMDRVANASSGGKEESVSSKVPSFVSMFYSELQPSYSFDDKEMEVGEYSSARRSELDNAKGDVVNMISSTVDDDDKFKHDGVDKRVNDTSIKTSIAHVQSDSKYVEVDGSEVEEPPISLRSVDDTTKVAPAKGKARLPKAIDDMGLGIVVGNEQPKHTGKIVHRRGNSLDFAIEQEGSAQRHGDIGSAKDQRRRDVGTSGEKSSSSRKGPSLVPKTSDHAKGQSGESSISKTNTHLVSASSSTSTSKHIRSRSAYDINELLMYEQRPRSKPGTTTSQLARRRNVSLSCDLDKDYTVGGMSAWLASMPSPPVPPVPPPIDGYAGSANRGVLSGGRVNKNQQDESSLRRAYTESLAPWRIATIAEPVNIPQKREATDKGQMHPTTKEKKKESRRVSTPPSSPSTPNSFLGSPSPGELNKKAGDFIARFHERMRLQRLESLERSRQRAH